MEPTCLETAPEIFSTVVSIVMYKSNILSHKSKYEVKNEITKQLSVVFLIVVIVVWQHHFLLQAAMADIYIFSLLTIAGVYGIAHTVIGTHKLAHEFIALHAMMEVYSDAVWHERAPDDARAAQAKRIKTPAYLYKTPHSLATAHNLIVEEAQRNGLFRISTGTMQVLVADLESKMEERQSLAHYLGALMVLLGLLGTFIGLMITLESVGGILGSIDVSGAGGTSAIGRLIESLKRPLEGMSTGFGASLLGLVGSLIIGFLSRIDGVAAARLKHEFETWIRSTVQLEAANSSSAHTSNAAASAAQDMHPRTLLRVARMTVSTMAQLSEQVSTLSKAVDHNRAELANHRTDMKALAQGIVASVNVQNQMLGGVSDIGGSVGAMREDLRAASRLLNSTLDVHLQGHTHIAQALTKEIGQLREAQSSTHSSLDAMNNKAELLTSEIEALSQSIVALIRSDAARSEAVRGDEVAMLLAELDHLMSVTRLEPKDVEALRHLAACVQDANGQKGASHLQSALKNLWPQDSAAQEGDDTSAPVSHTTQRGFA
jgi:biopolymer transport protein ExbB/TolQ